MGFETYKTKHKIIRYICKAATYTNNRYRLTLPTRIFIIVIGCIALLNSPAIPGGMALNPFIDKILGKIL